MWWAEDALATNTLLALVVIGLKGIARVTIDLQWTTDHHPYAMQHKWSLIGWLPKTLRMNRTGTRWCWPMLMSFWRRKEFMARLRKLVLDLALDVTLLSWTNQLEVKAKAERAKDLVKKPRSTKMRRTSVLKARSNVSIVAYISSMKKLPSDPKMIKSQ